MAFFAEGRLSPQSPEYRAWQQRFLIGRLQMALTLALFGYCSFILLEIGLTQQDPARLASGWLWLAGTVMGCLALVLMLSRSRWGQHHPAWLFVLASWSVTLKPPTNVSSTSFTWKNGVGFPSKAKAKGALTSSKVGALQHRVKAQPSGL